MADLKKWTVLHQLPDWMAGDTCCAADEVSRFWVEAATVEDAVVEADRKGAELFAWDTNEDGENYHDPAQEFSPVAVYEGHIFDHYTP